MTGRRSRPTTLVITAVVAGLVVAACGGGDGVPSNSAADGSPGRGPLVVYAPGPLESLLEELASDFPDRQLSFNLGHVPSLLAQLQEGSPGDVLVTPDEQSMNQAVEAGLVEEGPVVFAEDELAIVVPETNPAGISSLEDLARDGVRVAVCAPELPCGRLAEELFASQGVDVEVATAEPGGVGAILTKLAVGEVDAGVVFRAAAGAARPAAAISFVDVPAAADLRVRLCAAVLSATDDPAGAQALVDFLTGETAAATLEAFGYRRP